MVKYGTAMDVIKQALYYRSCLRWGVGRDGAGELGKSQAIKDLLDSCFRVRLSLKQSVYGGNRGRRRGSVWLRSFKRAKEADVCFRSIYSESCHV